MKDGFLSGFGSYHESQAKPGALPIGQNSPQVPPLGLYPEQISGSAFTCTRANNLRSWLYRIQPSVMAKGYEPLEHKSWANDAPQKVNPIPYRWNAPTLPSSQSKTANPNHNNQNDFIDSIQIWGISGDLKQGGSFGYYQFSKSMSTHNRFFHNQDAEMLLLPWSGTLKILTEFGTLQIGPLEIAVIPRGVKFAVDGCTNNDKQDSQTVFEGYVTENYGHPFKLPDLGPIGSNGLANPRDFHFPHAQFFVQTGEFEVINKFNGHFWRTTFTEHPLNVVAWHGNYAPYQYDLRDFNTLGSISFDHPDPSIFTVLTSPSAIAGVANLDFVIFPERWLVAEHTFRPPYYHKNIMSELMGLVHGQYDAKPDGFHVGGVSIHNMMTPHGPDSRAFEHATKKTLEPEFLANTMAFMLESSSIWRPTEQALRAPSLQTDYLSCWTNLPVLFKA